MCLPLQIPLFETMGRVLVSSNIVVYPLIVQP